MHQHLVDDELEEDGNYKAESVEQNGRDSDIDKQAPLAQKLGDEPAESERLLGRRARLIPLYQQNVTMPVGAKLFLVHEQRLVAPVRERIDDADTRTFAAATGACDHYPIA